MSSNARRAELRAEQLEREEREAAERAAKDEQYRYLPASWRAMDELTEEVGAIQADKIRALIDALIAELNDALIAELNDR